MQTTERPFGLYTVEHFSRYITDATELDTLKTWLSKKDNLNLDIFESPISFRFDIKIQINSALDRIYVYDRLDGDFVELTDWGSF